MAAFLLLTFCLQGCAPLDAPPLDAEDAAEAEEDSSSGVEFPLYSIDGEAQRGLFYAVCESEHAVAYVSAHAISKEAAQRLLDCFEETIRPGLTYPSSSEGTKLAVLLTHMAGETYGYTPFPIPEQGPVVCLNALYAKDLAYILAHEYQHLCAHEACAAGGTFLSEETDELLSDMFCELLFPSLAQSHALLSEERGQAARERIDEWGEDALMHVYAFLREGYSEEKMLLAMEKRVSG